MNAIRETLHQKRAVTEAHIRQLQQAGTQGVRYTAMIPDIPVLVCGLLCDLGGLTHLTAVIIWFCRNGVRRGLDFPALLAMAAVVVGVAYIIYLGKIHEKEIATRRQKDLSFGLTVFAGLAGAGVGALQLAIGAGGSPARVWVIVGGLLNFAAGLPIYLSFREGIVFGVK